MLVFDNFSFTKDNNSESNAIFQLNHNITLNKLLFMITKRESNRRTASALNVKASRLYVSLHCLLTVLNLSKLKK